MTRTLRYTANTVYSVARVCMNGLNCTHAINGMKSGINVSFSVAAQLIKKGENAEPIGTGPSYPPVSSRHTNCLELINIILFVCGFRTHTARGFQHRTV